MTTRFALAIAVLFLAGTLPVPVLSQGPKQPTRPVLYYIPHTHWEGAVFLTRQEYLQDGLTHILEALRLLEQYPDYKFTLDQVAYFKPFLERYPEQAAAFRRFVREGRLEIVGGMDVMPDDVKPGGELFIRQIQYGKLYCHKQLGIDVDVAWLLDTFGHHPQLPQLLKQAGFKSFWFCRGVPSDTVPSEFLWKGIDGSTIPSIWLPGSYGLFYGPPRDPAGFTRFFVERFNSLNRNTISSERVGLAGVDVSEPETYVTPLIRQFNRNQSAPFNIHIAVPSEFQRVVARRRNVPVKSYDLNPIFPGTYSSRIELKQTAKEIEEKLLNVERLTTLDDWLGSPFSPADIERAWEPVLFNQTHDLASGTMNDHVYADTVKSYGFSNRLADEMLESRSAALTAQIDTSGVGTPIVVFNSQSWRRTDMATVDLGIAQRGARAVRIVGSAGDSVPSQVAAAERYENGDLRRVKLSFLASDVPAIGYAVYHAVTYTATGVDNNAVLGRGDTLENTFYRVTVDVRTGAIISVMDKASGKETLSGPANVVARVEDHGDLWALNKTLDGSEHLPANITQSVPSSQSALLSTAEQGEVGTVTQGAVFQEFNVSHKFGTGAFATRIRLTRGVRRIEIETDLVNNEKHVRYQALFPTAVQNGTYTQSIPFGSVKRTANIEYPAQGWVDYGDGDKGFTLLNYAMPGNLEVHGTLMLSLMRAENLGDYTVGGDSGATGFELGVPRTLRYALMPHFGTWQRARAYRAAAEVASPLLVIKAAPHPGRMPKRWSAVAVSAASVVVTAMQPGPNYTVLLRVYEAAGISARNVRIVIGPNIAAAYSSNLLGDTQRRLTTSHNELIVDLHPYEIRTVKLRLAPGHRFR